jgi:hypothetical protein
MNTATSNHYPTSSEDTQAHATTPSDKPLKPQLIVKKGESIETDLDVVSLVQVWAEELIALVVNTKANLVIWV